MAWWWLTVPVVLWCLRAVWLYGSYGYAAVWPLWCYKNMAELMYTMAREGTQTVNVVDMGLWQQRFICIRSSEIMKKIYTHTTDFTRTDSTLLRAMKNAIGTNIVTSDAQLHKQLRPLYEKYFAEGIGGMFAATTGVIDDIIKTLKEGDVISIRDFVMRVTGEASIKSFLGVSGDVPFSVIEDTDYVFQYIRKYSMSLHVPAPTQDIIDARQRVYDYIASLQHVDIDPNSILAQAVQRHGWHNLRAVQEEAISMIVGGTETTSILLAWVCYYISKRPDLQQRLRDEWHGKELTSRSVMGMKLSRAVVYEALRLHSPAAVTVVQCINDGAIIPGIKPEVKARKGDLIYGVSFYMHRDPKLWAEPDLYNPDRFDTEDMSNVIPFGGGSFVCVGRQFSIQETIILLHALLTRYQVSYHSGNQRMDVAVTIRPASNICVKLEPLST